MVGSIAHGRIGPQNLLPSLRHSRKPQLWGSEHNPSARQLLASLGYPDKASGPTCAWQLLDVFHWQQGAVIARGGWFYGAGYYAIKGVAKLGKFRYQRFHYRGVVLESLGCIRNVRALVLHHQIEILSHCQWEERGQPLSLSSGRKFYGTGAGWQVRRFQCLRFIRQLIGQLGIHERQGDGQIARFDVVEPRIAVLALGLEGAGVVGKPS